MKMMCDEFKSHRKELYFYTDDDHRSVPNFDLLKHHSLNRSTNFDPFLDPTLFSNKEYAKTFEEASLRAENIFKDTQKVVLHLLKKRKSSLSTSEYLNYVRRIQTVRIASLLDPKIQKLAPGACDRPNAIYISSAHELLICPSIMNFPEMTLQKILAHELGHSIQKMQNSVSCFQDFSRGQKDEVFADWIASQVISEKIRAEKNLSIARKKAMESQLLFLSLACFSNENIATNYYPSIRNRVEKIFLAQADFQNAFQCQNPQIKRCE